jgi:hypothetical protein
LEVSKAHAEDADKSEEVESMNMTGGNFAEQHCKQKLEGEEGRVFVGKGKNQGGAVTLPTLLVWWPKI